MQSTFVNKNLTDPKGQSSPSIDVPACNKIGAAIANITVRKA